MVNASMKTVSKDKMEFIRRMAEDEGLAKCLLSNQPNFLDYEIKEGDLDTLPWKYIFPCKYIMDTQEIRQSYITMEFRYEKSYSSPIWRIGSFTIYALCHRELARTDYGMTRTDYMIDRIDNLLFQSKNDTWLGRLEFQGSSDIILDERGLFVGTYVTYRATEAHDTTVR